MNELEKIFEKLDREFLFYSFFKRETSFEFRVYRMEMCYWENATNGFGKSLLEAAKNAVKKIEKEE